MKKIFEFFYSLFSKKEKKPIVENNTKECKKLFKNNLPKSQLKYPVKNYSKPLSRNDYSHEDNNDLIDNITAISFLSTSLDDEQSKKYHSYESYDSGSYDSGSYDSGSYDSGSSD